MEMLGTLIAIKLWAKDKGGCEVRVEAFTDNRGNDFVLTKGMSTKYPLTFLLMEMSELMQERDIEVRLKWIRRDEN